MWEVIDFSEVVTKVVDISFKRRFYLFFRERGREKGGTKWKRNIDVREKH